jgi:hypothetical protein
MNETLDKDKTLTTADVAAGANRKAERVSEATREVAEQTGRREVIDADDPALARPERDEELAALFTPELAADFRSRWDAVQIGFVDDPQAAVRQADELVAQVMKNLAESFADERQRFDEQMNSSQGTASTENMRVALRRYRSFFQRLLSL